MLQNSHSLLDKSPMVMTFADLVTGRNLQDIYFPCVIQVQGAQV